MNIMILSKLRDIKLIHESSLHHFPQKLLRHPIHISRPHGQQQIPRPAVLLQVPHRVGEGGQVHAGEPGPGDPAGQVPGMNGAGVHLPGGIDIQDHELVDEPEGVDEIIE